MAGKQISARFFSRRTSMEPTCRFISPLVAVGKLSSVLVRLTSLNETFRAGNSGRPRQERTPSQRGSSWCLAINVRKDSAATNPSSRQKLELRAPSVLNFPRMVILILATRNEHKVAEIRAILGNGFGYRSLTDFPDAPEVAEDANTFAGNATKKVVALARWLSADDTSRVGQGYERLVLADDSGLEVDALNGAPGVHSARFAALDIGKPVN